MKYMEVAPTRIVRAGSGVFTYRAPDEVQPGHIVTIPVGKNTLTGLVVREVSKPDYDTKDCGEMLEETPLPGHLIALAEWLADYYHTPLATVLQTILPRGLGTKRRKTTEVEMTSVRERTKNVLNPAQQQAVDAITSQQSGTVILQGVTGSGKTEVYKHVARKTLEEGRSVIILVPEIGLTQQLVDELAHEFPNAILTHSQMTEAKRHLAWQRALRSDTPQVIIGPRSALFMPVQKLGAIIIDEAHEPSYKQEQAPRYSALRVASTLGVLAKTRVIFGSATPLVADRFLAEHHKTPVLRLNERARKDVKAPSVDLVDMTARDNTRNHQFLSPKLLTTIAENIEKQEQTLLFHNRRGSASTTLCENCGWTALCPRCMVPMVLHHDRFTLTCHICDLHQKVPTACPECGAADIIHKGVGTKRIEAELQRLFPHAKIARFDSDNAPTETLQARYQELYKGDVDIIIGTQVIAKGLDLPKLSTVGIIQADSGLALPDYAASERTFQLLAQAVGRVGRDSRETSIIVQTYQPTHPVVQTGLAQDYEKFYTETLEERQRAGFPPYRYLLQLTTSYKTEAAAIRSAKTLAAELRRIAPKTVEILGPTPAFYERTRDSYRWQLLLKSPIRHDLVTLLDHIPPTHWQSELDPASLL